MLLLLVPHVQASTTSSNHSNATTKTTIIAKDRKSGTLVYKKQGLYYYGVSGAQKIINQGQIEPRELIVKFKNHPEISVNRKQPFTVQSMAKLDPRLGLTLIKLSKDKNYFKTMQELRSSPNVEYVEPNYVVKAQSVPNDPYYGLQWGTQMIKAESAWDKLNLVSRAKVTVAVLDTGVNSSHEDLKDSIVSGYDFADDKQDTNDLVGHGTHVAGIVAAQTDNGIGITGIAKNCKIMPVKVLDDDGNGSDANIIEGIKYATDHGAQVINMSLGGPGESDALQDAINYATSHGVNVVVAAGNENGAIDTPGNCKGVITVGAIDRDGERASYSNFGTKLDVVAPGTDILSTYIGGTGPSGYTYFSGTSMAAPFVSGVVALIKSVNPNITPAAVTDIIHQSATHLDVSGFDKYHGYGLVNADKAVALALSRL
jgi:Subtilisin-like serine proteases